MQIKKKFPRKKQQDIVNKYSYPGSITVEAAFVMPIVLLTIFALIYLSFYLHDICRIQSVMDLTLHKTGITVKHEADIATGKAAYNNINDRGVFYLFFENTDEEENQVKNYLQRKLSSGLFLTKISKINAEVGKQTITLSVETETQVSLPGIKYLFMPLKKKVIQGDYPVHNPAETIRCTEVILETGSKIKGVDQLKERLEKIFGSK